MPAKNLSRISGDGIYLHIYNKGVENRAIFNDHEDYSVFISYLEDYLTTPKGRDSVKKNFSVHGQTFRGVPHQPKNYFNRIELVAYSLMPDHFHLLLHQKSKGSIEKFIRSLCTRYSIYFNKKYHRTGSLFTGPYRSIEAKEVSQLAILSRFFHFTGEYSSYPEYSGKRDSSWVKPSVILDSFKDKEGAYKDFMKEYSHDQASQELISGLSIEDPYHHLERRELESIGQPATKKTSKSHSRFPDFVAVSSSIFILLIILGLGNIKLSEIKSPATLPNPAVLGEAIIPKINSTLLKPRSTPIPVVVPTLPSQPQPEASSDASPKKSVVVKLGNSSASAIIREAPKTSAKKLMFSKNGDRFDVVSETADWDEIKLPNGSTGFISTNLVTLPEGSN